MNYPAAKLRGIVSREFLSHYIVTTQETAQYYVTIKAMDLITFLIILLVIEFFIIAVCLFIITYLLIKSLKTVANFTNSLGRMKALLTIPALFVALFSKIIKKRG